MVIPELIRLLTENGDIDGSPITMDEAIDIVSKSCAYTNHTILAEALEKWPVDYLNRVCLLYTSAHIVEQIVHQSRILQVRQVRYSIRLRKS